jgi:hypothetical protein
MLCDIVEGGKEGRKERRKGKWWEGGRKRKSMGFFSSWRENKDMDMNQALQTRTYRE